jgi:hypothetical protein
MLARVQVHCGWATNNSVGRSLADTSVLSAGHRSGAFAPEPGRFSNAQTTHSPEVTQVSQNPASATTTGAA